MDCEILFKKELQSSFTRLRLLVQQEVQSTASVMGTEQVPASVYVLRKTPVWGLKLIDADDDWAKIESVTERLGVVGHIKGPTLQ